MNRNDFVGYTSLGKEKRVTCFLRVILCRKYAMDYYISKFCTKDVRISCVLKWGISAFGYVMCVGLLMFDCL